MCFRHKMSTQTLCRDRKCILLTPDHDCILPCDQITHLKAQIKIIIPNGYILEVKNHLRSKNWRIGARYLFPENNEITIPVLAVKSSLIKAGKVLCHLQFITPTQMFSQLTGNYIHSYVAYFTILIWTVTVQISF
jgi:hypothetical protein